MPMDEQTCLEKLHSKTEFTWRPVWEEQIKAALLWRACCEAVARRDCARLSTWRQVMDEDQTKTFMAGIFGEQHVKAANAYLQCAELALDAARLPGEYPALKDALIALLHAAADIIAIPCDRNVDHGLLHTALEAQQTFVETDAHPDRQGTQEPALAPMDTVDMVFNILASKAYGPLPPVTRAWAWDVTRTLLGADRPVIFSCEVTVGTTGDQGFLPTLTLDVLKPGSGEVFHDPGDAFHTYADDNFLASMQEAWYGALDLAQQGAKRVWDGRWSLRQGRTPGSKPVSVANGRSASGAAARGWWHALMRKVPDEGVIVIAQVGAVGKDGVMQLKGVDDRGVFVKTQALAQDPRFDTIVVASQQDEVAALQALGDATHICVRNLAEA